MGGATQAFPTKFPCWCKAVYSWGGEGKKDLGFIEGDLIECLNAGDGSWWMGRLRRDRRMVGLFPSNFVQVLDEDFQPAPISRNMSPMASQTSSAAALAAAAAAAPSKQKSVFRKPFQGYKEFGYRDDGCNSKASTPDRDRPQKKSFSPYSSMKTATAPGMDKKATGASPLKEDSVPRIPSPPPRGGRRRVHSRPHSPTPTPMTRAASPAPMTVHRARSPAPHAMYGNHSPAPSAMYRAHSPAPSAMYGAVSSPAHHKSMYRAHSPAPSQYRPHSPAPPQAQYRPHSPAPQNQYRSHSPAPPNQYRPRSPANSSQFGPASSRPYHDQYSPSPTPQTMYNNEARSSSYQDPYYSRAPSPAPPVQYDQNSRGPSPAPPGHYQNMSRGPSPAPMDHYQNVSRGPSPASFADYQDHSRVASPAPLAGYQHMFRAPSPAPPGNPADLGSSSPPPPPPPHRVAYDPNRMPSSIRAQDHDEEDSGFHTPNRLSNNGVSTGMTPSPMRDAMNDIMSSLNDMSSVAGRSSPPQPNTPSNMWSPDAFSQFHSHSTQPLRAQSAMATRTRPDTAPFMPTQGTESIPSLPSSRDGPATVGNYVQRMENRLRHSQSSGTALSSSFQDQSRPMSRGHSQYGSRPTTASSNSNSDSSRFASEQIKAVSPRKSAYELGRQPLSRTMTTKTSATSSSSGWQSNVTTSTNTTTSTQMTDHSLMSGHSAGAFSATSAGSLARRKFGMGSTKMKRPLSAISSKSHGDIRSLYGNDRGKENDRPQSPVSGISYHSSHATQPAQTPKADWIRNPMEDAGVLGGLAAPKAKKSGFFKKMIETAKTGAANARSTINSNSRPSSRMGSPKKSNFPDGITAIAGGTAAPESPMINARDMGLGGGNSSGNGSDWMQVRRDVNRSNSLSKNERNERAERCDMHDVLVVNPIDELMEHAEGDEGLDGLAITDPTDFNTSNMALVDKSTRFITGLPPMATATTLAQSYLCRPYRSDVQRLRAIFTWVAERIAWEEDFEGQIDTRRVLQSKRGCSQEIAVLVRDLCAAVGLHAEIVRGYLKAPGEHLDLDIIAHPNHYWNAVIADGEWRIMDCSLAGPTNPKRSLYSSANPNVAETWYFLPRPMDICFTHVPLLPEQQHIVPPVPHEILVALPCACAPYFRHKVELVNFDTSMLHLDNLEMTHLQLAVPEDVECVAEVEARAFARDWDGDLFESGDIVRKSALAQAEWIGGRKHFVIKALLPGDEGQGVLKIYAGKRGLMHSTKDNPHALALALPLFHTGQNPPYTFLTRHPTPHAQRHDLYVAQPQCSRLVINNTFVFCVRQHPSSLSRFSPDTWGSSTATPSNGRSSAMSMIRPTSPNPNPYIRPASAMSMVSAAASQSQSQSGSAYSDGSMTEKQQKPAKLAMQSPSGKIIRLTRKQEYGSASGGRGREDVFAAAAKAAMGEDGDGVGSTWETVIKVGERGVWRGLVLADRSARWCVFAEWECV